MTGEGVRSGDRNHHAGAAYSCGSARGDRSVFWWTRNLPLPLRYNPILVRSVPINGEWQIRRIENTVIADGDYKEQTFSADPAPASVAGRLEGRGGRGFLGHGGIQRLFRLRRNCRREPVSGSRERGDGSGSVVERAATRRSRLVALLVPDRKGAAQRHERTAGSDYEHTCELSGFSTPCATDLGIHERAWLARPL